MDTPKNPVAVDLTEATHSSISNGGVLVLAILALVLVFLVLLVFCYCLSLRTKKEVSRRGEFIRVDSDLETMREGDIQLPLDIPTIVIDKNYICQPSPSIFSSINKTSGFTLESLNEDKSASLLALYSVGPNSEENNEQEARGMVFSLLDLVLMSVMERVGQNSRVQWAGHTEAESHSEHLTDESPSAKDLVSLSHLQPTSPNSPSDILFLSARSETAPPDTTVSSSTSPIQFLTPTSSPVSTPQIFFPPPLSTCCPLLPHLLAPSLTRRLSSSPISLSDSNCSPTVPPV